MRQLENECAICKVLLKRLDEIQLLPSTSSKKRFVFDYAYIARKAIIEAEQAIKEV